MLDHMGLEVADLDASVEFFTRVLAPLGVAPIMRVPDVACGFGDGQKPWFWVASRGRATSTDVHVAFEAPDRETVDRFHEAALAAGARDRAFVLDLEGNNIEAVCHRPE